MDFGRRCRPDHSRAPCPGRGAMTSTLFPVMPRRTTFWQYPLPWRLVDGLVARPRPPSDVAESLRVAFGAAGVELFGDGRGALAAALDSLGLAGARVGVATFTCPAVPDAILAAGATPVLLDVDDHGRCDAPSLAANAPDAVVFTHAFGQLETREAIEVAQSKGMTII